MADTKLKPNNDVRLIDANDVLKHVIPVRGEYDDSCPFPAVGIPHINGSPTIEAEPIRYGQLVNSDSPDYYEFSCCGAKVDKTVTLKFNYCYNCGAKMDGGDNK